MVELYTYFPVNKKYMESVQNGKKSYLMTVDNVDIWFYQSSKQRFYGFKSIGKYVPGSFFLDCYMTPYITLTDTQLPYGDNYLCYPHSSKIN